MSYDRKQTTEERKLPIACNLSDAEQAKRGEEVAEIFLHAEHIEELTNGYAFRFPGSAKWATRLIDFIVTERSCCPFFTFELIFEAGEGPIWLHLCGAEGVRDLIKNEFLTTYVETTPDKLVSNTRD